MESLEMEDWEWSSSQPLFLSSYAGSSSSSEQGQFTDFRPTRYLNERLLVIIVAVLTQVVVLSVIAMIMGIAVLTMCAVLGELLVITAIATALERQICTLSDVMTMLEVLATIMVTAITVFLAAVSSGNKLDGGITASRFV